MTSNYKITRVGIIIHWNNGEIEDISTQVPESIVRDLENYLDELEEEANSALRESEWTSKLNIISEIN